MPRESVLPLSLAGVPALAGQVIANVCGGTMHAGGVGGTVGPVADFSGGSTWLHHCEKKIVPYAIDLHDFMGDFILLTIRANTIGIYLFVARRSPSIT